MDFASPPDTTDAPIILGEAPPTEANDFIGTVDETPVATTEDAPILLGEPPADDVIVPAPEEPIVPAGPSAMQKWNEEWQATLLERKDNENGTKAEFIQVAEKDMKTFQDQREQKRESKMTKNRQDEQEKLEAIEADLENDNSWQKVCKMIELSHDSADNSADIKRMRDTIIFLKNEPAKATVLV